MQRLSSALEEKLTTLRQPLEKNTEKTSVFSAMQLLAEQQLLAQKEKAAKILQELNQQVRLSPDAYDLAAAQSSIMKEAEAGLILIKSPTWQREDITKIDALLEKMKELNKAAADYLESTATDKKASAATPTSTSAMINSLGGTLRSTAEDQKLMMKEPPTSQPVKHEDLAQSLKNTEDRMNSLAKKEAFLLDYVVKSAVKMAKTAINSNSDKSFAPAAAAAANGAALAAIKVSYTIQTDETAGTVAVAQQNSKHAEKSKATLNKDDAIKIAEAAVLSIVSTVNNIGTHLIGQIHGAIESGMLSGELMKTYHERFMKCMEMIEMISKDIPKLDLTQVESKLTQDFGSAMVKAHELLAMRGEKVELTSQSSDSIPPPRPM
jgi:hypothetical protein